MMAAHDCGVQMYRKSGIAITGGHPSAGLTNKSGSKAAPVLEYKYLILRFELLPYVANKRER